MQRVCVAIVSVLAAGAGAASQERTFAVPPNVTVDGVPPIPMSLVEAVSPYGQFRQARLVAWHPVERRLVVVTTFGNAPQLHQVGFPGAARTQLTFFADGVPARPGAVFAPAGDYLVFQKDTARGGEVNQLFRLDFAGGEPAALTRGAARHGAPVTSRSGLIAYDSTRRDGKNRDLYVMHPARPGSERLLAQLDGQWAALAWTPDESAVLAAQILSSSETYLWRIAAAGGERTLLTPKEAAPTRWLGAAIAPDGSIYALGNYRSDTPRLWRLSAGQWRPVSREGVVL